MNCIKHYILFAYLCVLTTAGGLSHAGGLVNTGGDPVIYLQLELQRKLIVRTLERIQSDHSTDPVGTENLLRGYCKNSGGLYSPEEVKTCASYIVETAAQVIACNYGEHKLDFIVTEVNTPELKELFKPKYPGNADKEVSAATYLSSCQEHHLIYINYSEFVRKMWSKDVYLTLAHEMGHKVQFQGRQIDDVNGVGGFNAGHKLLDAAAVALYIYGIGRDIPTPEQKKEALQLQEFKHFFACTVTHGMQVSDTFRFANQIVEDTDGRQVSRNYVSDPRGFELTPWTRVFAPREQYFLRLDLKGDFNGDFDCNSASDSDSYLSLFLLAPDGTKKPTILDKDFELENILCSPNSHPIILHYAEKDLTVECKFDGRHRL